MIVAIDPGKHSVFAAEFNDQKRLESVEEISHVDLSSGWAICFNVAVEVPEVNRFVPAQDLLDVTATALEMAGRIAGPRGKITRYTPTRWKGQVPKPIHHARMWKRLSKKERELLGGGKTLAAIEAAKERGSQDRWNKSGERYYRAREFPPDITHNHLDAVFLGLVHVGRAPMGGK